MPSPPRAVISGSFKMRLSIAMVLLVRNTIRFGSQGCHCEQTMPCRALFMPPSINKLHCLGQSIVIAFVSLFFYSDPTELDTYRNKRIFGLALQLGFYANGEICSLSGSTLPALQLVFWPLFLNTFTRPLKAPFAFYIIILAAITTKKCFQNL